MKEKKRGERERKREEEKGGEGWGGERDTEQKPRANDLFLWNSSCI